MYQCLSLSPPPSLRFLGTMKYMKGRWQKWARVASPQAGVARGGLAFSFWLLQSSGKI
jgi:hypothetical protein